MLENKKSQGHVEMIISMTLFIGALLFIFMFISPFSSKNEEVSYIKNIENQILANLTDKVWKLSIVANNSGGCYNFDENKYQTQINSNDPSSIKYIEVLESNGAVKKYNIYFSNFFSASYAPNKKEKGPDKCKKTDDYKLASFSEEDFIVYGKIQNMKNEYESYYESLKKILGINRDFSFSFRYLDGTEIPELKAEKNIPGLIQVESEDVPIRVMDENAKVNELILNLKVW